MHHDVCHQNVVIACSIFYSVFDLSAGTNLGVPFLCSWLMDLQAAIHHIDSESPMFCKTNWGFWDSQNVTPIWSYRVVQSMSASSRCGLHSCVVSAAEFPRQCFWDVQCCCCAYLTTKCYRVENKTFCVMPGPKNSALNSPSTKLNLRRSHIYFCCLEVNVFRAVSYEIRTTVLVQLLILLQSISPHKQCRQNRYKSPTPGLDLISQLQTTFVPSSICGASKSFVLLASCMYVLAAVSLCVCTIVLVNLPCLVKCFPARICCATDLGF